MALGPRGSSGLSSASRPKHHAGSGPLSSNVRPHHASMFDIGAIALALGGLLVALASLAHLACIALGARAYRIMGAGERMARAVEAGKIKPTLITLAIASVLLVWALYAFSGAGLAPRLPFTELALFLISTVFLARAVAFPVLRPRFPENSTTFWLVSSSICLVIGLLYAVGLAALWSRQ